MKPHYLAALAAIPMTGQAAMTELTDADLGAISGQAWVIEYPHLEIRIDDLTERDISLGPIPVSGILAAVEGRFPRVLERVRGRLLDGVEASVSLSAGVLRAAVPVLGRLPDATVRFETTGRADG